MAQNYTVGTAVLPARSMNAQGKEAPPARAMPFTVESQKLLRAAEAYIQRGKSSELSDEAFESAHFAALRVAGAVIEAVTSGAKTRRVETIWQKLSRVQPEFALFALIFEESASLRTRLELGDVSFLAGGAEAMWLDHAQRFLAQARDSFSV